MNNSYFYIVFKRLTHHYLLFLAVALASLLTSCENDEELEEYPYYFDNIVQWDLKLYDIILHIDLPVDLEDAIYESFSFTNRHNYYMNYPDLYFSVDEVTEDKLNEYVDLSLFPVKQLAERFLGDTTNIPPAFKLLMYADSKRINEYDYLFQSEVEKIILKSGLELYIRSMEFNNIGENHFYIFTAFSHNTNHYLLQCILAVENSNHFYADWLKIIDKLEISEI